MTFRRLGTPPETTEQEVARLSATPKGSRAHYWSTLPVRQEDVEVSGVYRLPEAQDGTYVVGVVTGINTKGKVTGGTRQRNRSYAVMVVGGTSETYRPGGYDLAVSETELRRAEKICL
ncbi:hypothetical protein [Corynebacterium sp. AOP12-C2-36]|uniref:hypothetical protein n=1 Tax=Corynebacterium sp. AOP12-C2-36 TaxID=3457723 RepID=UPI0040335903